MKKYEFRIFKYDDVGNKNIKYDLNKLQIDVLNSIFIKITLPKLQCNYIKNVKYILLNNVSLKINDETIYNAYPYNILLHDNDNDNDKCDGDLVKYVNISSALFDNLPLFNLKNKTVELVIEYDNIYKLTGYTYTGEKEWSDKEEEWSYKKDFIMTELICEGVDLTTDEKNNKHNTFIYGNQVQKYYSQSLNEYCRYSGGCEEHGIVDKGPQCGNSGCLRVFFRTYADHEINYILATLENTTKINHELLTNSEFSMKLDLKINDRIESILKCNYDLKKDEDELGLKLQDGMYIFSLCDNPFKDEYGPYNFSVIDYQKILYDYKSLYGTSVLLTVYYVNRKLYKIT